MSLSSQAQAVYIVFCLILFAIILSYTVPYINGFMEATPKTIANAGKVSDAVRLCITDLKRDSVTHVITNAEVSDCLKGRSL